MSKSQLRWGLFVSIILFLAGLQLNFIERIEIRQLPQLIQSIIDVLLIILVVIAIWYKESDLFRDLGTMAIIVMALYYIGTNDIVPMNWIDNMNSVLRRIISLVMIILSTGLIGVDILLLSKKS